MTRKNTAACTEIKKKPMDTHVYEIGHVINEKLEKIHVEATGITNEGDELGVWLEIKGKEEQVGAFKNWAYYKIIPEREPEASELE